MLQHHYTPSLPVKASWYDQQKVCSCQIAMRNVPVRGSIQGYQEHAKLVWKPVCSHGSHDWITWCIALVVSLLLAAGAQISPLLTGAFGYFADGLSQQP